MSMLRIESVSVAFDRPLLTNVSLDLAPAAGVVIAGPNGVGKSTLLKLVMGLLLPHSGAVLLDGQPIGEQRERLGYCPAATHGFYRRLTARQNLQFFGSLYGLSRRRVDHRLAALGLFDIDYWNEPVERLSEGMLQKIRITRAFLHEPDLVVLDEPLNFLDSESKARLLAWLKNWRAPHPSRPYRASVLTQHATELPGLDDAVWEIRDHALRPRAGAGGHS